MADKMSFIIMHLEELYVPIILGTLSSVKENIWKDFQSVCRNCEKKKMPQKRIWQPIWELLCGPIAIMKRGSAILIFKG